MRQDGEKGEKRKRKKKLKKKGYFQKKHSHNKYFVLLGDAGGKAGPSFSKPLCKTPQITSDAFGRVQGAHTHNREHLQPKGPPRWCLSDSLWERSCPAAAPAPLPGSFLPVLVSHPRVGHSGARAGCHPQQFPRQLARWQKQAARQKGEEQKKSHNVVPPRADFPWSTSHGPHPRLGAPLSTTRMT